MKVESEFRGAFVRFYRRLSTLRIAISLPLRADIPLARRLLRGVRHPI